MVFNWAIENEIWKNLLLPFVEWKWNKLDAKVLGKAADRLIFFRKKNPSYVDVYVSRKSLHLISFDGVLRKQKLNEILRNFFH